MPRKSKRSPRSTSRWHDPDDAPLITKAMLDRAEIRDGGKLVRRGRPPVGEQSKVPVTVRLDADVVAAYRRSGSGWQTRLNADLRRKLRLPALPLV